MSRSIISADWWRSGDTGITDCAGEEMKEMQDFISQISDIGTIMVLRNFIMDQLALRAITTDEGSFSHA